MSQITGDPLPDETQRQVEEIRKQLLDQRSESIDRWLTFIGIMLTIFAIAIPIGSYIKFEELKRAEKEMKKIEKQAKLSLNEIKLSFNEIINSKEEAKRSIDELNQFKGEAKAAIDKLKKRNAESKRPNSDSGNYQKVEALAKSIAKGEYVKVPVGLFVPAVLLSKQLTKDEMDKFVESAHKHLQNRLSAKAERTGDKPDDRWDIQVSGGEVFIFRTWDEEEFANALQGVVAVLAAIKGNKDISDISILVRGTERFFDVQGIPGVGSRAWIGFDLRE